MAGRILVVDRLPLMRRGIAALLATESDLTLVGEAAGRQDALLRFRALQPDLVLLDLPPTAIAERLALVSDLCAAQPGLPILLFALHDERRYAGPLLRAGARGVVGRQDAPRRLLAQIRAALAPRPAAVAPVAPEGACPAEPSGTARLSARELEVFGLFGRGESARQVALRLGISRKTVETHRERIKEKLGLATAAQLVARAARFLAEREHPLEHAARRPGL